MKYRKRIVEIVFAALFLMFFFSCRDNKKPAEKDVVTSPEKMPEHLSEDIKKLVEFALKNKASVNDSVHLNYMQLDSNLYDGKKFEAIWSGKEQWLAAGDSLY